MNNNYYNFTPNKIYPNASLRGVNMPFRGPVAPLPRISSLLGRNAVGIGSASKVTFSSLLNGASKTLGVINQAIPVFYQVKPIWRNAKTMFKVVKEINNKDTNNKQENIETNENITNKETKTSENSPTFFV